MGTGRLYLRLCWDQAQACDARVFRFGGLRHRADHLHTITAKLGAFKTSILQDAQAGRPIELNAHLGVMREIGQRVGVATSQIDTLYCLARLFGRVHGLYPGVSSYLSGSKLLTPSMELTSIGASTPGNEMRSPIAADVGPDKLSLGLFSRPYCRRWSAASNDRLSAGKFKF